jgi:hypothetical protein
MEVTSKVVQRLHSIRITLAGGGSFAPAPDAKNQRINQ